MRDPDGLPRELRRSMLDGLAELNEKRHAETGDAEIQTRIQQYEMAFRMQTSIPELTDLSDEPMKSFSCMDPTRVDQAVTHPTALWRVGWSSAECAWCTCSIPIGITTAV